MNLISLRIFSGAHTLFLCIVQLEKIKTIRISTQAACSSLVRINPELHQLVSRAAVEKGVSLNKVVQEAIQSYVQEETPSYKTKLKKRSGK